MVFDTERLRQYIPKGDGYNSEFAQDLEEAAQEIERLEIGLKTTMTTLKQIQETPRNAGAKRNANATVKFLQTQGIDA